MNYKRALLAFLTLCLVVMLFTACGSNQNDDGASAVESAPIERDETMQKESEIKALSESDLIITRQDYSTRSEQGELLAEVYYDLVQLPDTTDAYKKINSYLQEDFQKFKNDIEGEDFQRYLSNAASSRADYDGDDWWNYYDTLKLKGCLI